MKRILSLYIFIIIFGQATGFSNVQQIIDKRLGVENGLSSNYVVGITQDKNGFLWIATEAGLNRFDGKQFTVYKKYSSKITSNELNAVCADPVDNIIWIATQRDGLCAYDCDADTFAIYKSAGGAVATNDITSVNPSADNKGVWISTYHAGINYLDKSTGRFSHLYEHNVKGLGGKKTFTCCDDGEGNLYIGHDFSGMSIVSLADSSMRNFMHEPGNKDCIPGNNVNTIFIDSNKNVWIGTNHGLALFNKSNGKFISFRHDPKNSQSLLSDQIMDIKQTNDGKLWVCSNRGGVSILDIKNIAFYSPEEIRFTNISVSESDNGLSSPNARCLFQDCYENIWIGNYRGGIDFISKENVAFSTLNYKAESNKRKINKQVWGMLACNDSIWIGGEDELLLFENGKKLLSYPLNSFRTQTQTHINVIYKDSKERLWLGTYLNGILYYDSAKKKIIPVGNDDKERELNVHCFYEDKNGRILIGTESGIFIYDDGKLAKEEVMMNQLPDRKVHSIIEDKDHNMWIGTYGQGISVFDSEEKLTWNFIVDNGFCSNAVNYMIKDSSDRIWAATREGLALFENTSEPFIYTIMSERQGLVNSHVRAICEDKSGGIWISTNGGITHLNAGSGRFDNYDYHYGVPMGDFMDGSVCSTSNGQIYFGSQNGACFFSPENVCKTRESAPVSITRVSVYSQIKESQEKEYSIPLHDNKISIDHNQNTFKIFFNVLNFAQSSQAEFAYKLDGVDNVWYNSNGENHVTFRNIAPGKYTFMVRSRLRNQQWDENVALLNIEIIPPVWQRWYAKCVYIFVCILIVYLIFYFYKRKLALENSLELEKSKSQNEQELNNERIAFYTNITHELRTPLTLIIGPLGELMEDKDLSQAQSRKIGLIYNSSERLLSLINHILEFRKTESRNRKLCVKPEDLPRLVTEIGLQYKELNTNKELRYNIDIRTSDSIIYFDSEVVRVIIDNLISNAIKYTPQGEITLSLATEVINDEKYSVIKISDTGCGINDSELSNIFNRFYQIKNNHAAPGTGIGLAMVKSLVSLHEGLLEVESKVNEGSIFSVKLRTDNTYSGAGMIADVIDKAPVHVISDNTATDKQKPIVLIVEDNNDIRDYLNNILSVDFNVIEACNGKSGWEMALNSIPDLVISDIMMPVMDGIQLCGNIKNDIRTSHIPVILLTAKESIKDKEEGYMVGADSYITKPFSSRLITSRIKNIIENRSKIARLMASDQSKSNDKQGPDETLMNKLDNEFMKKVTLIVEDNLTMEKIDIPFIAEKMCMSHSTLYRKIKALTDMSANEYIKKIKLRNGERLLMEQNHNVSEISFLLGFSSAAYFRQCFKEEYGMSPTEYLKSKKGV